MLAPLSATIILGIYRPNPEFFRRQLASLAGQTYPHCQFLLCPDGPHPSFEAAFHTDLPTRTTVYPQDERLGVYGNFMRGLREALQRTASTHYAFCDQDDIWWPEKIARQIEALRQSGEGLTVCDARVITARDEVFSPSLFKLEKRFPHKKLDDLLIRNDVSGHSMLFTTEVAKRAVAFAPRLRDPSQKAVLHDWWTALVARLMGPTTFTSETLIDYRRHTTNVMGPSVAKPASRLWGAKLFDNAWRMKAARHFAVRHLLAKSLKAMSTADNLFWPDSALMNVMIGQSSAFGPLLARYWQAMKNGDKLRSQSLYMMMLGLYEITKFRHGTDDQHVDGHQTRFCCDRFLRNLM